MKNDALASIRTAVDRQRKALADRDAAMLTAREAGHTWQAIADAAGMTPHGVRYALKLRAEQPADGTGAPEAP